MVYRPFAVFRLLKDSTYNKIHHIETEFCKCLQGKPAFARLANPFSSGLDSLLRLWRSKARNPRKPSFAYAHSYGFALAELIIFFTIISVMLALSAPGLMINFVFLGGIAPIHP